VCFLKYIFLVSYRLNMLLIPVPTGGERSSMRNRKTASVTLPAFQRQQEKSGSIDMMK
jgi:hypothetical protein